MPAEPAYVRGMPRAALMTADELLQTHLPDRQVELVRGVLVVREPPGLRHGRITTEIAARLAPFVRAAGLGPGYVESGVKLTSDPDTVRGPALAFISRKRLPDPEPEGFPDLAPDLVVEVLSPRDRPGEVLAKVADWLTPGPGPAQGGPPGPRRDAARLGRRSGAPADPGLPARRKRIDRGGGRGARRRGCPARIRLPARGHSVVAGSRNQRGPRSLGPPLDRAGLPALAMTPPGSPYHCWRQPPLPALTQFCWTMKFLLPTVMFQTPVPLFWNI